MFINLHRDINLHVARRVAGTKSLLVRLGRTLAVSLRLTVIPT
jgi:hypothetical protein